MPGSASGESKAAQAVSRDPLHIEHLHIRNFKAFQDARMENIPSVCLLVGKNGTGKSTLWSRMSPRLSAEGAASLKQSIAARTGRSSLR